MIMIGPVIPGRRGRPFSPDQAQLIGWWAADDIVGSEAATWTDRSGHGNDLTQGTVSARLAVVSADADFNGHKSVQGASGDFIRRATLVQGTLAQPYTKYSVIKLPTVWVANEHFFSNGHASGTAPGDMATNISGRLVGYAGAFVNVNGVPVGDIGVFRVCFDGVTSHGRWVPFSGAEVSATGSAGVTSLVGVCLMGFGPGSNNFTGKMADALHVAGDTRDTPGLDDKIVNYLLATYRP